MRIYPCLLIVLTGGPTSAIAGEATAVVSKDSLAFEIPVQDAETTWEWNVRAKGAIEHQWVISFPLAGGSVGRPKEFCIAVVQSSSGPPAVRGSLGDLLAQSKIMKWIAEKGDRPEDCDTYDTFVGFTYKGGIIKFTFYQQLLVHQVNRIRPADLTLQGVHADGSRYNGPVRVTNIKDPREEEARAISGPFSPNEYAIYQTVIDRAFNSPFNSDTRYRADLDFVLLTPSTSTGTLLQEAENIKILGADDESVRDYLAKRSMAADVSSLAALGYEVVDADTFHESQRQAILAGRPRRSVRVSVIGFNDARDQAILYVETSSGMLGGMGQAIRLDKVDGEWLVTRQVELWIS